MIRVSASAFDILWQDLGHARVPVPLDVRGVGGTAAERAEIREAVYENLAERGLATAGRAGSTLSSRLETLADADVYVECEALVSLDDETPLRAVAAAGGRRAVLAAQPSRTIGLSAIRDAELFPAIVGLLPPFDAGPGFGVSVPSSALEGKASDAVAKQLAEIRAIQARPVLGAGQFSVRVRENGRVRRVGGVSWFTTGAGAYCGMVAPGRGGEDWLTLIPADPARLAARLAELLD
ncbi:ESX secretion-associated protein EspG [Amycolatopsis sp. GM8]|uniref:ESX secretion-associated protein EspG n=1 Tax=Amycolatopsis sp. GM8 TaxID=2896530 RepID=UPI001F3F956A|nr:ESX secretion-associated protein EspG [Amycolatopsis sp. GM8]